MRINPRFYPLQDLCDGWPSKHSGGGNSSYTTSVKSLFSGPLVEQAAGYLGMLRRMPGAVWEASGVSKRYRIADTLLNPAAYLKVLAALELEMLHRKKKQLETSDIYRLHQLAMTVLNAAEGVTKQLPMDTHVMGTVQLHTEIVPPSAIEALQAYLKTIR